MSSAILFSLLLAQSSAIDTPPALPTIAPGPVLTLRQALDEAQTNNLRLQTTQAELDKAQATLKAAWALLLPSLTGQVQYTHNDHQDTADIAGQVMSMLQQAVAGTPLASSFHPPAADPVVVRQQDDLRASLTAVVPLFVPQAWAQKEVAEQGTVVADDVVAQVREQILFATAQAFLGAHISLETVHLQEAQLDSMRRHVEVTQARINAGDALRIDLLRAQTEMERTIQDLLSAHLALDNARDALATLLGRTDLPLPDAPPVLVAPNETPELDALVSLRPDVRVATAQRGLAEQQLTASWRQFWPNLVAGGQYGYQFTDPPELGSNDRSRWAVSLSLSIPIFNEARYADVDQKQAQLVAAQRHEADVKRNAETELKRARRDYLAGLATLQNAQRQAALAREAATLMEAAFANGTSTSLDVTDAQRTLHTAELLAVSQELRCRIALLTLYKAMGTPAHELAGPTPVK